MKAIADTGFLVAFLMADDAFHPWAKELAAQVTPPLLTCDAVIAETAFKLRSVEHTLSTIESCLVAINFDLAREWPRLKLLAASYADQRPDLADLCLVRMSERFPDRPVITVDRDFRIYRRNKSEPIPLITPPNF